MSRTSLTKLILILTFAIFMGKDTHAQQWQLYNQSNSSLLHNWTLSLAQDQSGDIWIGSVDGLNRKSGSTWSSFTSSNTGMPRNEVWDIKIDASNSVWLAIPFSNALNQPGAIMKFDGSSWFAYNPTNNRNYRKIGIDDDQNVWIAISSYYLQGQTQIKGHLVQMSPTGVPLNVFTPNNTPFPWYVNTFRSVLPAPGGIVWAGTQDGGMGRYDGSDWTIFSPQNSGITDYNVYDIIIDRNNFLWIATSAGLGRYDMTTNEWTSYRPDNSPLPISVIRALAVDSLNNIWIGTLNGLAKFDGQNWSIFTSANSGLPPPSPSSPGYEVIEALMIDKWGNKWIGTRNGLAVYNESGITNINGVSTETPVSYELRQNFPNPFNPVTNINFSIPESGMTGLTVYDINGREISTIVRKDLEAGSYTYMFNASNLASGIYFYKLSSREFSEVKKMILIK